MADFGNNDARETDLPPDTELTLKPNVGGFGQSDPVMQRRPRGSLSPRDDLDARLEGEERARLRGEAQVGKNVPILRNITGMIQGPGAALMQDSMSFGLGQKLSGLMESEVFGGRGREYGEAAHQYYLDALRGEAAAPAVSEFAGAMLTPSPFQKAGALATIGEAVVGAGVEEAARQLPSEANIKDVATTGATAGGIAGGLFGFGRLISAGTRQAADGGSELTQNALRGKKIGEAADIARTDLNVRKTPAIVGSEFGDNVRGEFGDLARSGKDKINRANEGDFSIQAGTEGRVQVDPNTGQRLVVTDIRPGRSFQKAVGDGPNSAYNRIRTAQDLDPIPISPEGTPAAYRLREIIDETAENDTFTLRDIDQLRTKIRGLRSTAINATDRGAVDDMEAALEETIEGLVASGKFRGDISDWSLYKQGRKELGKVLEAKDSTALKKLLNDETIPGSTIADTFMRIDTPAKRAKASRMISDVSKTLGEDSEALTSLRAGMLSKIFESDDPRVLYKNLKVFQDDPELISNIFDPATANKLTELAISMDNMNLSELSPARTRDLVGPLLNHVANTLGSSRVSRLASAAARPSAGMSIATGAATGSPVAGLAAGGVVEALHQLSRKPVRRVLGSAAMASAPGAAREMAVDERIPQYITDEQAIQNALPDILQGVR